MRTPLFRLAWLLPLAYVSTAAAAPLGPGFTYQGRLELNGIAVTVPTTLRFSLWDAAGSGAPPTGGSQIGASQILANVPISNGTFTVLLNSAGEFGASAFNGDTRWLQIDVCTNPGCTTPTALSPRQAITANPFALRAAAPWQTTGSDISFIGGRVGIGRTPSYLLDVNGEIASGELVARNAYGGSYGEVIIVPFYSRKRLLSSYWDGVNGDYVDIEVPGNDGAGNRLRITSRGAVGIGTTVPAAALDVRGSIKLGPSGQDYAPGGAEELRMIRGSVDNAPNILAGGGFTVARRYAYAGSYIITFSPQFSGRPTVTANTSDVFSTVTVKSVDQYSCVIEVGRISIPSPGAPNLQWDFFGSPFEFIALGPR